jgi:FdhD protein
MNSSTTDIKIKRFTGNILTDADDVLAMEEPLEIRLMYISNSSRVTKKVSVTMRTPGHDKELATGFLFTEGIIKNFHELSSIDSLAENIIQLTLADNLSFDLSKLDRNFYTTSSCGVCGKSSIEAVTQVCEVYPKGRHFECAVETIYKLPEILRTHQDVFQFTGGLHASALFDTSGDLLLTREDIGRHNALDKLIGAMLEKDMVPVDNHILLLSGRASFELIQKAAMAGIRFVAAVGAPSSLAVEMAKDYDMTLVGFLRGERFNIYCGAERIIL